MVPFLKNVRTIPIFLVDLYFSVLEYIVLYRILFLFENLKIINYFLKKIIKGQYQAKSVPPPGGGRYRIYRFRAHIYYVKTYTTLVLITWYWLVPRFQQNPPYPGKSLAVA
jgi:hypothetical protein